MHKQTDIGGQMGRWATELIKKQTSKRTNRLIERLINEPTDKLTSRQTDRQTNRRTDGRMDGRTDGRTDGQTDRLWNLLMAMLIERHTGIPFTDIKYNSETDRQMTKQTTLQASRQRDLWTNELIN